MMAQQHFCFKWNNYQANMSEVFHNMLLNENMVDVTIACEGASIKAHKMVLAACSPFFQNLFMTNPCKHPIVILKDVRFIDLKATIDFMYKGEVNVSQDQVSSLLKTAETLKVKGLSDITEKQTRTGSSPQPVLFTKGKRRKRNRHKSSPSKEGGESECSSDSDEENKYRQAVNNRQSLPRTLRAITYQKDKEQPTHQVNEQEENIDESQQLSLQQQSQTEEEQMEPSRILEQSIATAEVEEAENGQEDVVIASDVHVIPNDEGIKQVALYQESIDMTQSGNAQILSLPGTSVTTYKPPGENIRSFYGFKFIYAHTFFELIRKGFIFSDDSKSVQ